MRAARLHRPAPIEQRPLALEDVPAPDVSDTAVLVRVSACGICRTDLHVVEGELPERRMPVVPGHQIVGTIAAVGPHVTGHAVGDRVGIAWLHRTCGECAYCVRGRENLCDGPLFTGYTRDGGYATHAVADARYSFPLGETGSDAELAPLLCAGATAGELWAAEERGVHCSDDGGKRWRRVAGYATPPQHLRGLALMA